MPPRSTKAPKLTTDDTTPWRISPGLRLVRNSSRCSRWVSSRYARRDSTTLLRFLSSSMILHSSVRPTNGCEVADAAQVDERCGEEAPQADVEDQAALDDLDDRAGDDLVLLLERLDRAPGALVLRPLLGEDESTVLVLLGEDQRLELLVERDHLVGVDVVADRELARGDDALGLVPDVEQHLVAVDLDDLAGDDVAVVERDDGRVDRVGERLAAQVVEDDGRVVVLAPSCSRRGDSRAAAVATSANGSVASGPAVGSRRRSPRLRLGDGGLGAPSRPPRPDPTTGLLESIGSAVARGRVMRSSRTRATQPPAGTAGTGYMLSARRRPTSSNSGRSRSGGVAS